MMPIAKISLLTLLEDRRQVTEVASILEFTISYIAFEPLLAEKQIYM
ncbi:hypothetical protein SYJ56_05780 [Algoriphagus sp. D3-2-R+10]|nr:hypothetical protein [Algoriphagus sp. D3-2-R+10]MEB2774806.1 hypothetical protein [Algoriphagus sp. D3-2-R+10]